MVGGTITDRFGCRFMERPILIGIQDLSITTISEHCVTTDEKSQRSRTRASKTYARTRRPCQPVAPRVHHRSRASSFWRHGLLRFRIDRKRPLEVPLVRLESPKQTRHKPHPLAQALADRTPTDFGYVQPRPSALGQAIWGFGSGVFVTHP